MALDVYLILFNWMCGGNFELRTRVMSYVLCGVLFTNKDFGDKSAKKFDLGWLCFVLNAVKNARRYGLGVGSIPNKRALGLSRYKGALHT